MAENILRNECSNNSQDGRKEEKRMKSGELQKTVSTSRGGSVNLTSLTRFFATFLSQYSTSNVKAWSRFIIPTNCKLFIHWRKQILHNEKIFANSVCLCLQLPEDMELFFRNEAHFELNWHVNKQNRRS